MRLSYWKRLKIWEMNFGRDEGWIVERNGHPIGILSNPTLEAGTCSGTATTWKSSPRIESYGNA